MPSYPKDWIRDLVDRKLPWQLTKQMMSEFKDENRFDHYLAVLQERVPWDDAILLPLGEHLFIVQKEGGERVVKCDCGQEFGDYRENWKLEALVYIRDTREKLDEIYPGHRKCDPEWMELREFYCPGCATQLEVEAVTPGYPLIFDFLPDLEVFYRDWLGREL
ncbi:MAG: acetone carboxylase subunit gamma [Proteobacteria bacterium]|nr:acetone carboxylase subunit gamma [Pseudomonadota bacterium]